MKGQRTKPKISASSFTSLFFTMGPFVNVCRFDWFHETLRGEFGTGRLRVELSIVSLLCIKNEWAESFTGAIRVESALRDETLWDTACLLSWITVSPHHHPSPQRYSFHPPQHKATSAADARFGFLSAVWGCCTTSLSELAELPAQLRV